MRVLLAIERELYEQLREEYSVRQLVPLILDRFKGTTIRDYTLESAKAYKKASNAEFEDFVIVKLENCEWVWDSSMKKKTYDFKGSAGIVVEVEALKER